VGDSQRRPVPLAPLMALKQGKNVPQGPESATNSSSDSNAIPYHSMQVPCVEWAYLLQGCNKYEGQLIELPADLPYLTRDRSNWHSIFSSRKLETG
jgi:hypothetical protein